MRLLTADEMRSLDADAVARFGDVELMRRAGLAVATLASQFAGGHRIVGVVGPGNNGGDVFAAFAELDPSYECIAVEVTPPEHPSPARRDARNRALAAGARIVQAVDDRISPVLADADLLLDGLLGVGSRLPLGPEIARWTKLLRDRRNVLSIDVPTGVDATTGSVDSDAIAALATITLGAPKVGLFLETARPYVGELWLADLGMADLEPKTNGGYVSLTDAEAAFRMPYRKTGSDKRESGAPLIVAGSEQFPGAAALCARAAARAGAGYVTVAAPTSAVATLRAHLTEQVVVGFDDTEPARAAQTILDLSNHCGAIGIGPGLGLSDNVGKIVRKVIQESSLPIVIDAGALFHLAKHLDVVRGKAAVLTPHAGEFARLSGEGTLRPGVRLQRLRAFVARAGVVTLLKGPTTLVDDGTRVYLNTTGTNALATAGTGDVLTGVIATLLSQGLSPFDAASLGAFWHGRAGKMAQADRPVGVIASDVIQYLGFAVPSTNADNAPPIRLF